jgi:hypothetical protein
MPSDDFYKGDKEELLGQHDGSRAANIVIGKIYQGD